MKIICSAAILLTLLLIMCCNSLVYASVDEWQFTIKIEYAYRDLLVGIQVIIDAGTKHEQRAIIGDSGSVTVNLKTGVHSIYIEDVFYISNGSRCEFQNWILDRCGRTWYKDNPITIVVPGDKEVEAYFILKHKLKAETAPFKQSLLVDGEVYNTPFEIWLIGRYVTLTAPESFRYNNITYIFKSWIDNYNRTYLTNTIKIYVDKPIHIIATYYTTNTTCDLKIIAVDEQGKPLSGINVNIDNTYNLETDSYGMCKISIIGGIHSITIQEDIEFTSNDTKIQFYMWDDGSSNRMRIMDLAGEITLTAIYKYYYKLRIEAIGLRENINTLISINEEKWRLNPKGEIALWICRGRILNISFPETIYLDNETRYSLKEIITGDKYKYESPTVLYTATTPMTIHVYYQVQYLVQVVSDYAKPYGHGWYDEGEIAYIGLHSDTYYYNQSVRYVFEGWIGSLNLSRPSFIINVNEPKKIVALWDEQYNVKLIFKNLNGTSIINPESVTVILQNNTRISISNFSSLWLNPGSIKFEHIILAGETIHLDRSMIINKTGIIEVPCMIGDLAIRVMDVFGNPANNAKITVTFPNSSKLVLYTDNNGYVYVHNVCLDNLSVNVKHLLQNIDLYNRQGLSIINTRILVSYKTIIEITRISLAFIFTLITATIFKRSFRNREINDS